MTSSTPLDRVGALAGGGGLVANAEVVRLTRVSCGWSMKRLAEAAAVSPSHVSRVESGSLPLAGKPLTDYARALQCSPEVLCVSFARSPSLGAHVRGPAAAAEWKRDRLWARANLVAMRLGRIAACADIDPVLSLPDIDPARYCGEPGPGAATPPWQEPGEVTAARVLRRLWRIAGPIRSMTELLDTAGVFVVAEDFGERGLDAITLRSTRQHPHMIYVDAALPPDVMRMALAHELAHLVMDGISPVGPVETERRAMAFAAEFLAPIDDIAYDLGCIGGRAIDTPAMLDDLRITWGVPVVSLAERARARGLLSDYRYRSLIRRLTETGRTHPDRPGVVPERPTLTKRVVGQLQDGGYSVEEIDNISLLTRAQRATLFQLDTRHLTLVRETD